MNKGRRNDVAPNFNDTAIMDTLSRYDYIYRGLQAFAYIKENPVILNRHASDQEHIATLNSYVFMLLKTFYSECGLSYGELSIEQTDLSFEIMINTRLRESEMEENFCLFQSAVLTSIKEALDQIDHDWKKVIFVCEGNTLWYGIDLDMNGEHFTDYRSNLRCYRRDKEDYVFDEGEDEIKI